MPNKLTVKGSAHNSNLYATDYSVGTIFQSSLGAGSLWMVVGRGGDNDKNALVDLRSGNLATTNPFIFGQVIGTKSTVTLEVGEE